MPAAIRSDGSLPNSWGANGSAFLLQLQLLDLAINDISGTLPTAWGANGGFNNLQYAVNADHLVHAANMSRTFNVCRWSQLS